MYGMGRNQKQIAWACDVSLLIDLQNNTALFYKVKLTVRQTQMMPLPIVRENTSGTYPINAADCVVHNFTTQAYSNAWGTFVKFPVV